MDRQTDIARCRAAIAANYFKDMIIFILDKTLHYMHKIPMCNFTYRITLLSMWFFKAIYFKAGEIWDSLGKCLGLGVANTEGSEQSPCI